MIIEVKEISGWKAALGQILSYAMSYPDRQKVIAIFNVVDGIHDELLVVIRKTFHRYDVELMIRQL